MNDIHEAELVGNETAKCRRMPWWGWVLGVLGVLIGVPICIVTAAVLYIGVVSPDTSVYPGKAMPQRFITEMKDLGALSENEEVLYFYSDAFIDIRDGFYSVSDRRVVIYSEMMEGDPLVIYEFPVSSEYNRDEDFFEAISLRLQPSESSDAEIDDWQLDDDV
ncbi:MAG: hypothetical protein CMJ77_24700 [Planctomycetaceae bacterium]|nr:hypothetical protein [Planctomycetaceae bacterium]